MERPIDIWDEAATLVRYYLDLAEGEEEVVTFPDGSNRLVRHLVKDTWDNPAREPGGMLFGFLSPDGRSRAGIQQCGCLTQIKAFGYEQEAVDFNEDLRDLSLPVSQAGRLDRGLAKAIWEDKRIPEDPLDVDKNNLVAFVEWQRSYHGSNPTKLKHGQWSLAVEELHHLIAHFGLTVRRWGNQTMTWDRDEIPYTACAPSSSGLPSIGSSSGTGPTCGS